MILCWVEWENHHSLEFKLLSSVVWVVLEHHQQLLNVYNLRNSCSTSLHPCFFVYIRGMRSLLLDDHLQGLRILHEHQLLRQVFISDGGIHLGYSCKILSSKLIIHIYILVRWVKFLKVEVLMEIQTFSHLQVLNFLHHPMRQDNSITIELSSVSMELVGP